VDLGQFVSRGSSLAKIYSVDAVEVKLPIPDSELAFLDLPLSYRQDPMAQDSVHAARVILRADFAGKRHQWIGKIVRTEGEIDPRTRMVHAVARVEDPYGRSSHSDRPPLAVGMFVEAEIFGKRSGRVMPLPRSVLLGTDQVLIVDAEDRLYFRKVELFRSERDRILVKSGLDKGDRIVVSSLEGAVDGMRVRVQSAKSPQGTDPVRELSE
jgi:multidrug efflux pump subunit AcrA (membrane-fusion protein)